MPDISLGLDILAGEAARQIELGAQQDREDVLIQQEEAFRRIQLEKEIDHRTSLQLLEIANENENARRKREIDQKKLDEAIAKRQETERSNKATESETFRHHKATEAAKAKEQLMKEEEDERENREEHDFKMMNQLSMDIGRLQKLREGSFDKWGAPIFGIFTEDDAERLKSMIDQLNSLRQKYQMGEEEKGDDPFVGPRNRGERILDPNVTGPQEF